MPSNLDLLTIGGGESPRAAVLFLVFNRPETTARVFAAIREARPPRLYVAADGPRPDRPTELANCARVREIALAVDWPCEVQTLLRETNLGCRRAVEEALDWFFTREQMGIVLEDDCLPSQSFFRFCEQLLVRQRDNSRLFSISGSNFQGGHLRGDFSYYFSKHFHCWGWASWRRAWQAYRSANTPDAKSLARGMSHLGDGNKLFASYWRQIADSSNRREIDSWAYRVTLHCWACGGTPDEWLHVIPQRNLVANIGFGESSTHTRGTETYTAASHLDFPLRHPSQLLRDTAADRYTDRYHFGIAPWPYLRRRLDMSLPAIGRFWRRLRDGMR